MKWQRIKAAVTTHTFRLTATYIGIIMLMSIGFSIIFYNTSSHELGRQIPPPSFFNDQDTTFTTRPKGINEFLQNRINEGRQELLDRLILLNVTALVGGSIISYALARRTLEPIEAAMDAQVQFVSDASHELRTPLTALQVTNEVALRKPKLNPAEVKELLQYNVDEAVALRDLSNALLGLVKPLDKTATVAYSLQAAVTTAINHVIVAAQLKNVTIEDTVPNVSLQGHQAAIEQVLTILLDNAVKYGKKGGSVTLTAQQTAKHSIITVADDGVGIAPADIPHIFKRFYRADKSRVSDGYGLGLAIAQRIVAQEQGTLTVASKVGKGTTFSLKLPSASL